MSYQLIDQTVKAIQFTGGNSQIIAEHFGMGYDHNPVRPGCGADGVDLMFWGEPLSRNDWIVEVNDGNEYIILDPRSFGYLFRKCTPC